MTVGSASTRETPLRSKALSVWFKVLAPPKWLMVFSAPDESDVPFSEKVLSCLNVPQLPVSVDDVTPSCLAMLRCISAMVTLIIT